VRTVAVLRRPLVPGPIDDVQTRKVGALPVVDPVRIDPDTRQLVFSEPYRRPLTEAEFLILPWPRCPRPGCDGRIAVEARQVTPRETGGRRR
jgi:hypothetical protein